MSTLLQPAEAFIVDLAARAAASNAVSAIVLSAGEDAARLLGAAVRAVPEGSALETQLAQLGGAFHSLCAFSLAT
jgi:hypothetical protein